MNCVHFTHIDKELFLREQGVIAKDRIGVWLVETWKSISALELNWQLKPVSALYRFVLMHNILLLLFYVLYFTEHLSFWVCQYG